VRRRFDRLFFSMICSNCNAQFDGDTCPACGAAVTSPTAALISAAAQLLKEGLADQAIEALEQALSRDPGSYQAHSLMGAAYMRQQEYALAGHHFERAVWLDSGQAAARYNLAVAYRAAGRLNDALQQVRAALDKDPRHEKSKALLKELQKASANGAVEPEPGAPENRPRAAAPHLQPIRVSGARLSHRARVTLAAMSALTALILGSFGYAWVFRLLTSPQLLGRDAVLWGQLPYAFGVIIFVAGVIAASFQAEGFPLAGAAAGFLGLPVGAALVLRGEGEPVTAKMVLAAALCGAAAGAAVEAFAKFTRAGEFRRALLWMSIAGAVAYVIVGYGRQGSLRGYVTLDVPDSNGQSVLTRVPDAEIALTDEHNGRTYATASVNAQKSHRRASAQGSYQLRGMPVGRYMLRCVEPESGASWEGEVYVDYAIVQGNELEIPLSLPLERALPQKRAAG
jgi:hypothetical protein